MFFPTTITAMNLQLAVFSLTRKKYFLKLLQARQNQVSDTSNSDTVRVMFIGLAVQFQCSGKVRLYNSWATATIS